MHGSATVRISKPVMSGINFDYVDLWLTVKHIETGWQQYQKELDEAIEAWFRYQSRNRFSIQ